MNSEHTNGRSRETDKVLWSPGDRTVIHCADDLQTTMAPASMHSSEPEPGMGHGPAFVLSRLNLTQWIRENRAHLKPPVSNRQLLTESRDAVVFVSGGPNTRNDYHVNPTEELFLQIKGDIAVRVRPLDGSKPHDVIVRQGELFLLPRWVPHRPQRPAGTIGLVVEFPRPPGQLDGLRWYCDRCDTLVHEARWQLRKIDEDLKVIMERFWDGPVDRRTCPSCGLVIQRAGAITLTKGRVRLASTTAGGRSARRSAATRPRGRGTTTNRARKADRRRAGRGGRR